MRSPAKRDGGWRILLWIWLSDATRVMWRAIMTRREIADYLESSEAARPRYQLRSRLLSMLRRDERRTLYEATGTQASGAEEMKYAVIYEQTATGYSAYAPD